MQVDQIKAEGLNYEYSVVILEDDLAAQTGERLVELAKTMKIPGFRPGKVPVNLVKQRFGDQVRAEALEKTVQKTIEDVVEKNGHKPASQPAVEDIKLDGDNPAEFTLKIENLPDVTPMDFSSLNLERLSVEISEAEVDDALKKLATDVKDSEKDESGKTLEMGDIAIIDFDGEVNGEKKEGMKADSFNLELGSNALIPGFEEQLTGLSVGDTKDVIVTFPEEYAATDIAGKEAKFAVEIKEIRVQKPSEINDDLAKKMGLDSVQDLRSKLEGNLEGQVKSASQSLLKRKVMDLLHENHDFELPKSLLDSEFKRIWSQVENAREKGNLEEEDANKDEETLKKEYKAIAERRIKLGLLLSEVARLNNLSITQDELSSAVRAEVMKYPGQEKQAMEYFQKTPSALQALQAPILEDKAVTFILEIANVSERKVSRTELEQELEKLSDNT